MHKYSPVGIKQIEKSKNKLLFWSNQISLQKEMLSSLPSCYKLQTYICVPEWFLAEKFASLWLIFQFFRTLQPSVRVAAD